MAGIFADTALTIISTTDRKWPSHQMSNLAGCRVSLKSIPTEMELELPPVSCWGMAVFFILIPDCSLVEPMPVGGRGWGGREEGGRGCAGERKVGGGGREGERKVGGRVWTFVQ